jgi:Zn-dependent protease
MIQQIIITFPILLFSIVLHEYCHGYMAYLCGDNTAKQQGRLTMNPIPHIDLMGSIILPAILIFSNSPFLIGYPKPVPVNPNNFRDYKKHHIYVSLAGVSANLLLAMIFTLLLGLYVNLFSPDKNSVFILMFMYGIQINVILAVFNLLPIPPLDGSWVLYHLLPRDLAAMYQKIFPYGFFIIIFLLMTNMLHLIIMPLNNIILGFLSMILTFFN